MAKIVETISFNNLAPNVVQPMTFTINLFERARTLATNFRWMKPTKVTWTIEPQFNTFQSVPGGSSVPYLYKIMNRTQDSQGMTLSDLLTQGARPLKLIRADSTTYRPNWCSPGLLVQNVVPQSGFGGVVNNVVMTGMKAEYDWCQAPDAFPPSAIRPIISFQGGAVPGFPANDAVANVAGEVRYNGHQLFIQQVTNSATIPTFKVSCTVHWSFKDPKNILASPVDNIFADLSGNFEDPTD